MPASESCPIAESLATGKRPSIACGPGRPHLDGDRFPAPPHWHHDADRSARQYPCPRCNLYTLRASLGLYPGGVRGGSASPLVINAPTRQLKARSTLTKETPLAYLLRRSSRARAKAPRRGAPARPGSEETQTKPSRALPHPSAELQRPLRRSTPSIAALLTPVSPAIADRPLRRTVAA